ncbi:MAG: stage II sporulation protein M, partial [Caldimonas sp.]
MTPLQFEAAHQPLWRELEAACVLGDRKKRPKRDVTAVTDETGDAAFDRARFAELYRTTCEHLALAQARSYPVAMIERLEAVTARGHQRIYAQADFGLGRLTRLFLVDFPAAVRAHRAEVLIALLVFVVPLFAVGVASYRDPGFILSVLDVQAVDQYDQMYGDSDGPLGRATAGSDWAMFGHYIRNN